MNTDTAQEMEACQELEEIQLKNIEKYNQYIGLRRIESCEFGVTTLFLWQNRNHQHVYFDSNYMLIFGYFKDHIFSEMPMCKEEFFKDAFEKTVEIFRNFKNDFVMYSVDEKFAEIIEKDYAEDFVVTTDRDYSDYLYDAEKMRQLSGKKLRKKRNHINAFTRDYEGRYAYRLLKEEDRGIIQPFLEKWTENHEHMNQQVRDEIEGIDYVMQHLHVLDGKALGVFIDNQLEALSIASTINQGKEVIIHVEKANTEIRGLYPFISQCFIQEFYPEVLLVNREEDLGIEGLRKSKLSYEPVRLEHKYTIRLKK